MATLASATRTALGELNLRVDDLSPDMRAEAEWLAIEISTADDVRTFFNELIGNEVNLSPEDLCASWYALGCALAPLVAAEADAEAKRIAAYQAARVAA